MLYVSGSGPVCQMTDKCAFPFMVEVVGSKPNVKDVMKTVMQDMSSIEVLPFILDILNMQEQYYRGNNMRFSAH